MVSEVTDLRTSSRTLSSKSWRGERLEPVHERRRRSEERDSFIRPIAIGVNKCFGHLLELSRGRTGRRIGSTAPAVVTRRRWAADAAAERRRVRALVLALELVPRRPHKVGVVPRDDVGDAVGEREGVPALKVAVAAAAAYAVAASADAAATAEAVARAANRVEVAVADYGVATADAVARAEARLGLGLPLCATAAPNDGVMCSEKKSI